MDVHRNSLHLGFNFLHEGCGALCKLCLSREGPILGDPLVFGRVVHLLEILIWSNKCVFVAYTRDSAPFVGL